MSEAGASSARQQPGEASSLAAWIGLVAGPVLALIVFAVLPRGGDGGLSHSACACAGVATLMAVWWMTEALPLEATALLPLALLPLTGVYSSDIRPGDLVQVKDLKAQARVVSVEGEDAVVAFKSPTRTEEARRELKELTKDSAFKRAALPFADPAIFLFLGGFLIALAIERWGLHRRIALLVVLGVGTQPARLIGGVMLATALISMWISNTATAVMMLPIGLSVIGLLTDKLGDRNATEGIPYSNDASNFAICLLLGIAYAASLGGFATLVGTPPNVFFAGYMRDRGVPISFFHWMAFATPLSFIYLALAWWLMTKWLFPVRLKKIEGGRQLILEQYRALGPVSRGEWIVLIVFLGTAALWMSGQYLKEWTALVRLVPIIHSLDDSLVAMTGAILLFLIPVDPARRVFALDWKTAIKLPWGVLLLFGGGLSLAAAITDSGLAPWIGSQVSVLRSMPTIWQLVVVVALIVFSGELTNNLAAVVAMLPILFEIAVGMKIDPLLFCVPAVVAASCGFMLPVATPPNAIVFGAGHMELRHMIRAGFWLDLAAVVLIPLFAYTLGAWVLGIKM